MNELERADYYSEPFWRTVEKGPSAQARLVPCRVNVLEVRFISRGFARLASGTF
jgi:hypothetical protein